MQNFALGAVWLLHLNFIAFYNKALTMSMELFGLKWKISDVRKSGKLYYNVLVNDQIGIVVFTHNYLQAITVKNEWKKKDYYKLLSLIHEKYLQRKPYLIYNNNDSDIIKICMTYNITPVENIKILDDFPRDIIDVQNRSLLMLSNSNPKYGKRITIKKEAQLCTFFAESFNDWYFIVKAMKIRNWINYNDLERDIYIIIDKNFKETFFTITEEGWLHIENETNRNKSKQVFIAMSFNEKMNSAAKAIENAIKECELKALRIDSKEHNNEISGEILLEIKNSRIVIADVTGQRNGVYFEAGFALGHNKSVIWTCKKSDEKNIHFDTRQYNYIIWDKEKELFDKLKNRIKATIAIEDI